MLVGVGILKEPVEITIKHGVATTDNLSVPCTENDTFSAAFEANVEDVSNCLCGTTVNFNRMIT